MRGQGALGEAAAAQAGNPPGKPRAGLLAAPAGEPRTAPSAPEGASPLSPEPSYSPPPPPLQALSRDLMLSSKSSASCRLTMLPPARSRSCSRTGDAGPGGALRAEAGGGAGGGAGREQAGRLGLARGPPAPGGVTHRGAGPCRCPSGGCGSPNAVQTAQAAARGGCGGSCSQADPVAPHRKGRGQGS